MDLDNFKPQIPTILEGDEEKGRCAPALQIAPPDFPVGGEGWSITYC